MHPGGVTTASAWMRCRSLHHHLAGEAVRPDDYWLTRIKDNRLRGLMAELAEAINDCDSADLAYLVKGSLRLGLLNLAARKEQELRDAERKRKLSLVRRPPVRLGQ